MTPTEAARKTASIFLALRKPDLIDAHLTIITQCVDDANAEKDKAIKIMREANTELLADARKLAKALNDISKSRDMNVGGMQCVAHNALADWRKKYGN